MVRVWIRVRGKIWVRVWMVASLGMGNLLLRNAIESLSMVVQVLVEIS